MILSSAERAGLAQALVKRGLSALGYYGMQLRRREFPGVAILCFHGVVDGDRTNVPFEALHVSSERFEEHCSVLARYCSLVSLDDLLAYRGGREALPPRPVHVTFDDGYASVMELALPILEKYRIPATVFVTTDPIRNQELFWFDAMALTRGEAECRRATVGPFEEWKEVQDTARLPAPSESPVRPLTVAQLKALAAHPLIEIGAHTRTHPRLLAAPPAMQQHEVVGSRDELNSWLGGNVRAFAYPYGAPGIDYSTEIAALVRQSGYTCAFNTKSAFASPAHDMWQLPRFMMLESIGPSELLHRLTHSWPRLAA